MLQQAFVGCLKNVSELFHDLRVLTNATGPRRRLTPLRGRAVLTQPWPTTRVACVDTELKTLRSAREPHLEAYAKCFVREQQVRYDARHRARDGTIHRVPDSADRPHVPIVPNVWHASRAPIHHGRHARDVPPGQGRGAASARARESGRLPTAPRPSSCHAR